MTARKMVPYEREERALGILDHRRAAAAERCATDAAERLAVAAAAAVVVAAAAAVASAVAAATAATSAVAAANAAASASAVAAVVVDHDGACVDEPHYKRAEPAELPERV